MHQSDSRCAIPDDVRHLRITEGGDVIDDASAGLECSGGHACLGGVDGDRCPEAREHTDDGDHAADLLGGVDAGGPRAGALPSGPGTLAEQGYRLLDGAVSCEEATAV